MYLVNILCNDRRVRSTALGFFIPFLILVTLERFYSTFLSVFYIFGVTAITFGSIGFRHYQYGVQAFLLGIVAGYSLVINMSSDHQNMAIFSRYTLMLSLFHFTEALFTGLTNNENLKSDSFLLNHSVQYWLAAVASWLEFGLESIGMPWINSNYVSYFGVLLCFSGEVIRKVSMWHAKSAFTHLIAYRKIKQHSLVTDGIYGYVRHPGYLGWFMWSVGTQIILCNPICLVIYAYVTFHFFEDRIYDEERYLIEFFGQRYVNYQREVYIGIPFIEGYKLRTPVVVNAHQD